MTLDELLALLPDNTTGEISAADMRTIVTDLFGIHDHLADTTDAHDASAVSIVDAAALYGGADVEAALQEIKRVAAGANLTATLSGDTIVIATEPVWASKVTPLAAVAANPQVVNNTITVVDDTELTVAVVANAVYEVRAHIFYEGPGSGVAGADFRIGWGGPAGASFSWGGVAMIDNVAASTGAVSRVHRTITDTLVMGALNVGSPFIVDIFGVLRVGTTAGNFRHRFAQAVATVADTTRRADSALILTRIA